MLEAALEAAVWLNILFDEEKKQEICAQVNPLMHVRDVGLRLRPSSNSVELPPMEQLIEAGQKGVSKDCSRCLYSLFENHSNDCKQRDYEDIKESNDSQPLHVLASKNSKTGLQQVETSISFTSAVLQSHLILLARDLLNILIANWPTQLDLWPEKFELNDWAELAALLDLLSTTPGINQKFEATLARVFHVGLEQTYLSDASEFLRSMAVVGCQFLLEASGQRHSTLEFSRTDGTAEVVRVNLSGATFCSVALEGFNGGKLVLATSADFISHRMEFDGKKVKKTNGKLKGILLEGDEVWLEYTSPSQSRSGAVTVHLDGHVVGRFSLGYELLLLSFSALESGKSNLISSIPLDTVIKSLVSAVLGSFGDRQLKIIGLLVKLAKFLLERPAEDFAQKPNLHEFASLWRLYDAAKKAMGSDLYTTVKPRLSRALVDFLYLVENLAIKWGQESDLASVVMPSAPLDKCYAQAIRSIAFITAAVNYPCQAQTLARLSSFCNGTTLTPFSSD